MLYLENTNLEGERMTFGEAQKFFKQFGIFIGGNWEYDRGMFDGVLHRENGETIYLRMPFTVVKGELDSRKAVIQFEKPFIIKHVVNLGLDYDSNSLITVSGLAQFQKPLDNDGYLPNKSEWQEFGEELVGDILDKLNK